MVTKMAVETISCPECSQLNTKGRSTCKSCGIILKEGLGDTSKDKIDAKPEQAKADAPYRFLIFTWLLVAMSIEFNITNCTRRITSGVIEDIFSSLGSVSVPVIASIIIAYIPWLINKRENFARYLFWSLLIAGSALEGLSILGWYTGSH